MCINLLEKNAIVTNFTSKSMIITILSKTGFTDEINQKCWGLLIDQYVIGNKLGVGTFICNLTVLNVIVKYSIYRIVMVNTLTVYCIKLI